MQHNMDQTRRSTKTKTRASKFNLTHRDARAKLTRREKHTTVKVHLNSLWELHSNVTQKRLHKEVEIEGGDIRKHIPGRLNSVVAHKLDETRINDWRQVRKNVLLPGQSGPSPASHRFADKFAFPSLPAIAAELCSFPPAQANDLGQSMLETAHPVILVVPRGLIMSTSPGALLDLPPLNVSPPNCCNSLGAFHLSGPRDLPKHAWLPALCATVPEDSTCISTREPIVLWHETSHPLDVLGIPSAQHAAEPSVFLNGEELLRSCRRNPASRSSQRPLCCRTLGYVFPQEFLGQHSMGRSLLNVFRPWLRRPLICVSVEPDPCRKQPRTTRICTQANSIPSFKGMRVTSISAAPLGRISRLIFLRVSRYLDGGAGDEKDVVGPHQNFKQFPFWSPGHCRSPTIPEQRQFLNQHGHDLIPARRCSRPPCLMPRSKLNEALFVKPRHGRPRSSRFSLTAAAAENAVAPFSSNASPKISALFVQTCHQARDNVQTLPARSEPNN